MRTDNMATNRVRLLTGCCVFALGLLAGAAQARDDDHDDRDHFKIEHDSLVISSSTYDPTQGAVAALTPGSVLPNTAKATTTAISGNNYVTVWSNSSVDGSFGVTSPILLTDLDAFTGRVLHKIGVPEEAVVTSFSSKSELGPILFT